MTTQRDEYDSPWKEALNVYFPNFLSFFFPDIYEDIDWAREYEFLDTELRQVMRDDEIGAREADKLVKVWRLDGSETFVLIHIEVQGKAQTDFAERMYVYNSRIFGLYRQKVVSLAILADDRESWRPTEYRYTMWGGEVLLKFLTVKLLDYQNQWATLEASVNPFAVLVRAHLKTQATRQKPQERLEWKVSIVKSLYQRGYNRSEIRQLFRLIDWMMALPENFELGFEQEIQLYEEENQMPYVTSIERRAQAKGMILKGREDIIDVLQIRFQEVPSKLARAINKIEDEEQLKTLHRQAVTIGSLAEFEQAIALLTASAPGETPTAS